MGEPVKGFCPMGCGQTLMLSHDGHIFCYDNECDDHHAVHKLLENPEVEHVVEFIHGGFEWTIQHPLRERVGGDLFRCDFHEHLRADLNNDHIGREDGRYRVVYVGHDPVSSYLGAPMCTYERLEN